MLCNGTYVYLFYSAIMSAWHAQSPCRNGLLWVFSHFRIVRRLVVVTIMVIITRDFLAIPGESALFPHGTKAHL